MSGPTIDAKIRLAAQFDGALRALRDLRREVTGVNETATRTKGRPFGGLRDGANELADQIRTIRNQVLGLFGLQIGVEGLRGLAQLSDGYVAMSARLRIATGDQEAYNAALAETRLLAKEYQQPLSAVTTLYTRQLAALKPLGGGLKEVSVATEAVLASLRISGATAAESAGAILQFSQAMGAGALRGEEFNAMAEAAPRLLQALADGLGRPRGELKLLAEQGQLTTASVVEALRKQLPQLRDEVRAIPLTVGGAVTQARDSLMELVGATSEGSVGIQALTGAIRLLAENIKPLVNGIVLLGAALVALKIGAVAGGFVTWAASVGSVAGALPALIGGLRVLLALVGGPVGLVFAIGSLVLGWNALSDAKRKAAGRSLDAVRAERDAVQAEVDQMRKELREANSRSPQALLQLREAEGKLRRLDAELSEQQQRYYDDLRRQAGARGGPGLNDEGSALRDPAAIRRFQEEYKLRSDIVKKFEEERRAYTTAVDREIAAARAKGDEATAQKLASDRTLYLAEQAKAEQEALRKFAAEQTVTRIAQLKERFDKELELLRDRLEREQKLNQAQYDAGLRDLATYLATKKRLDEEAIAAELRDLDAQLAQRRQVLATNRQRLNAATTANDREQIDETIFQQEQDILRLETEIERKQRDRVDAARALAEEEARITAELRRQLADVDTQIKQALGTETFEDIARRVQDQFSGLMEKVFQDGGDTDLVERLINTTVLRESFAKVEREYAQMLANLSNQEAAINAQAEAGTISRLQAEREILALRAAQLPDLQRQADLLRQVSQGLGPEERNRADGVANQVAGMRNLQTEMEKTARSSGAQSLSNLFTDLATRSKSAKEAFGDMVSSFGKRMLDLINQRLGEQLLESLFPSGAAGAGGGGWMAALSQAFASLFHTGGIVGSNGSGVRAVSPLAWLGAPRYHTSGIVGLKPRERAIIAMDGEEVLDEENPRHIKNFRRNAAGVTVDMDIHIQPGQSAGAGAQAAAADLGAAVEAACDAWALKQSRPGGLLYSG